MQNAVGAPRAPHRSRAYSGAAAAARVLPAFAAGGELDVLLQRRPVGGDQARVRGQPGGLAGDSDITGTLVVSEPGVRAHGTFASVPIDGRAGR